MATALGARGLGVTAMKVGMEGQAMGEWEPATEEDTGVGKWEEA